LLPRTGRPKRSAMGVSGTNRPSHVYAEHANARDSYHGCAATPPRQPRSSTCSSRNALPRGRGGDPVSSPRSTPGLPRVPRCSRRCCSGTGSKNTATVLNTSATPPMKRACPGRPVPWVKTTVNQPRAPLVLSRSHGAAGYANRSVSAIARIGADPQHPVRGIPGQVNDLVLGHAGHGRSGDRSGERVPCFDELVLCPLVVLKGQGQTVGCYARSMPPRRLA
jgi:hypothetical protein